VRAEGRRASRTLRRGRVCYGNRVLGNTFPEIRASVDQVEQPTTTTHHSNAIWRKRRWAVPTLRSQPRLSAYGVCGLQSAIAAPFICGRSVQTTIYPRTEGADYCSANSAFTGAIGAPLPRTTTVPASLSCQACFRRSKAIQRNPSPKGKVETR
jgi:hypothetical protein